MPGGSPAQVRVRAALAQDMIATWRSSYASGKLTSKRRTTGIAEAAHLPVGRIYARRQQGLTSEARATVYGMWPNSRRRFHPKSKVPWQLLHNDLIKVPLGRDRPGIFWLRLYANAEDHVAVVTEVPGNPASSTTNAMKAIADWTTENFAIQPERLVIYEIWPHGSIGWERRNVRLVDFSLDMR